MQYYLTKPGSTFGDMAMLVTVFVALVALIFTACAVPSTEHSCAPFFFQKVKYGSKVHTSIVRFKCDESPPFDGTCDPTFTERVYYRAISGYSCLVEYLARPTPLLEEPACSDREGYDSYFKQLGMTATSAGWVLQDAKSGVLLQIRPNIPYKLAFKPCDKYFKRHKYEYVGGTNGHAWEGANATHHIWYSPIAQDYRYSACVLSTDSRRSNLVKELPYEGEPPGDVAGSSCPAGMVRNSKGNCVAPQMVG